VYLQHKGIDYIRALFSLFRGILWNTNVSVLQQDWKNVFHLSTHFPDAFCATLQTQRWDMFSSSPRPHRFSGPPSLLLMCIGSSYPGSKAAGM